MPDIYVQKPVEVEAVQFLGWQSLNFEGLMLWLNNYRPFYVPRGYEHRLRYENEKDHSRGDTLEYADPFLILDIGGERVRVDIRTWLIKTRDGKLTSRTNDDFVKEFDKVNND